MKIRSPLFGAIVVLLAATWALTPSVVHFLGQEAINRLHEEGIRVRVDGLAGSRIGLAAEAIEGWFSLPLDGSRISVPISLKAEQADVRFKVPILTPWAPHVLFTAQSYGGVVKGELGSIVTGPELNLTMQGANVSLHPQARAFGVEDGVFDARIENHPLQGIPRQEARYSLDVRELTITLPRMVSQIARISSVSNGLLVARGSLKSNGRFTVEPCTFKSSLGNVSLTANGSLQGRVLKDLRGKASVDLSTEEGAVLRPWLGLLVPASRLPAEGPVLCDFRSAPCAGSQATQLRLGALCIRLDCGG